MGDGLPARAMLRVRDRGLTYGGLADHVLVVCPACGGCAEVAAAGGNARLACGGCGKVVTPPGPAGVRRVCRWRDDGRDPWFGAPLWLSLSTRHGVLFALNERHLAELEAFVAARLRERTRAAYGWHNASLHSRLPLWLKRARNRAEVLHALARLRRKLG